MAQLGEAISRYHKLVEQEGFGDGSWADELQERMRQLHLTESGRVVAPILRPHFISRRQLDTLTRVTNHLAEILDRIEAIALASPHLLNRLQMLPAEKMLAAIPSGYSRFSVTSSMDAAVRNGSSASRVWTPVSRLASRIRAVGRSVPGITDRKGIQARPL